MLSSGKLKPINWNEMAQEIRLFWLYSTLERIWLWRCAISILILCSIRLWLQYSVAKNIIYTQWLWIIVVEICVGIPSSHTQWTFVSLRNSRVIIRFVFGLRCNSLNSGKSFLLFSLVSPFDHFDLFHPHRARTYQRVFAETFNRNRIQNTGGGSEDPNQFRRILNGIENFLIQNCVSRSVACCIVEALLPFCNRHAELWFGDTAFNRKTPQIKTWIVKIEKNKKKTKQWTQRQGPTSLHQQN